MSVGWILLLSGVNVGLTLLVVAAVMLAWKTLGQQITSQAPAPPAEGLGEMLALLHTLTARMDQNVGSHTSKVSEINDRLRGAGGDRQRVVSAVAEILEINHRLVSELSAARGELNDYRQQIADLVSVARTDSLTRLLNRRGIEEDLGRRLDQARRFDTPLSLLLLDIDHFKKFNDEHGHEAGDAVLRELGHVLAANVREMDIPARYGGEEFAVVMPETRLADASRVAERLRAAIVAHEFVYGTERLTVRVSLGLAAAAEGDDVPALVRRADTALYAAKEAGRDCAFAANGGGCARIEPDLEAFREALERTVVLQALTDQFTPVNNERRRIRCRELDDRGFTFVVFQRPSAELLAVSRGRAEAEAPRVAKVVRMSCIGPAELPRYEVVCEYTGNTCPAASAGGQTALQSA